MRKIKLVIPKGRIYSNIVELLHDAGIDVAANERHYIPHLSDLEIDAKIMKPQNIAQLIQLGSHDIGFTGYDWIVETGAHRISCFNREGQLISVLGGRGTGPGRFNFPTFIWIDRQGQVYVVDSMNHRIQIFDPEGDFLGAAFATGQEREGRGAGWQIQGHADRTAEGRGRIGELAGEGG